MAGLWSFLKSRGGGLPSPEWKGRRPPGRGLKLARPGQRTSNPQHTYFRSEYRASVFLISTRAAIESGILHFARAASTPSRGCTNLTVWEVQTRKSARCPAS